MPASPTPVDVTVLSTVVMETSADPAVAEQHAFVSKAIVGARRVLEVGAGQGHLARRLEADGFSVTALDLSPPADPEPSGVRWVQGDFLGFDDEPFDAVLFTASLHHITPLDAALERARGLLARGGVLVVDDFDLEAPDEATARWYYEVQELLVATGTYDACRLHAPRDLQALQRWQAEHEHHDVPLHAGRAMLAGIEQVFRSLEVTRGPYLYRYICAGTSNVGVAQHLLSVETRRIADGSLRPVGLRVVARAHV
jgi:SAM-dependent methyltransferase